jgi:hypothetical protein
VSRLASPTKVIAFVVCFPLAVLTSPMRLSAQFTPDCAGTCITYAVSVTPDGGYLSVPAVSV